MPEHIFSLAARGVSVDAQTNMLTIFGVVEQVGPQGFPAAVPEMTMVTLWKRLPNEEGVGFVQRTRFMDPNGKELGAVENSFRFDRPRQRMLTNVRMFPLRTSGCHHIQIQIRRDDTEKWGKAVAAYPIEVFAPDAEPSDLLPESSDADIE